MRLRGVGRVKRWWRITAAPLQSRVVILLYHRVLEATSDPQLLCITPRHFAEHLEYLRHRYCVLSLRELGGVLKEGGRLPKRAVVVTFDDGYADNLWNARPLLARFEIPATVFVTAGYVGKEREFWWDAVERLVLHPGRLPTMLRLAINGATHRWHLGEAAEYSPQDRKRYGRWHVLEKHDPTPRHRLYRELCRLLGPLSEKERSQVLGGLESWAGVDGQARPEYRALSADELVRLSQDGLVEIGAHTMTHAVLSALPVEEQRWEIQSVKQELEAILGRPVVHFAYPYGSRSDYTAETVAMVREAGFACACSNFGGTVGRNSDPYQLSRCLVRDWDGEEFARRLERSFRE